MSMTPYAGTPLPPADEFRALIESTGIKLTKVAEHAGVSKTCVYHWQTGKHKIPKMVIEWLRRVNAVVNEGGTR